MMQFIPYQAQFEKEWDDFIVRCPMATFLHSRKFLGYHQDRFRDQSLLCYDTKNKLIAVFPAALSEDSTCVISHPGSTYGGLLHQGTLLGTAMVDLLAALFQYYFSQNFSSLIYKAIPHIYHHMPSADDEYALFKHQAVLYRRDLSCTINLNADFPLSGNHAAKMRNMLRKAKKHGVELSYATHHVDEFWQLLEKHLENKYQKKPVHRLHEIKLLMELFPDNIKLLTAILDKQIVAGAVVFISNKVVHTQYLMNTERGMEMFALDYLIQEYINLAQQQGYYFFDFGISNEQDGQFLNQNLHLFKAKHGGAGVMHNFYKVVLKDRVG